MFMALLYRKIFLYHNHPSSLSVEEVLVIEGILDPIYDPQNTLTCKTEHWERSVSALKWGSKHKVLKGLFIQLQGMDLQLKSSELGISALHKDKLYTKIKPF